MPMMWGVLKYLVAPLAVLALVLAVLWKVYDEGKSCRANCADTIAACEERRANDHAALMLEREALLAQKTKFLEEAQQQLKGMKNESVRLQAIATRANDDLRAARAQLASLRDSDAALGDSPVPDAAAGGAGVDGDAAERRTSSAAFAHACAQDALTVFRWQAFFEEQRRQFNQEIEP